MPLNTLAGPLGKKRAAHLLRRTCLGGTIQEIDEFALLTAQEATARLFNSDLPDPILPADPDTGAEWVESGGTDTENSDLENALFNWHIGQMIGQGVDESLKLPYIFRERLVFFFHTHFTTKKSVVRNARALFYQMALFRLFAFDQEDLERTIPSTDPEVPDEVVSSPRNLKQLTKKLSLDNAMLRFLDGRFNVKGNPNENYARELLELYTIGRGLEGNVPEPEFDGDYFTFTEQDVQEGAKVLSGYDTDDALFDNNAIATVNQDPETGLPQGVLKGGITANRHEEGIKTFSDRLGGASVTPDATLTADLQVADEISQLVDLIYDQQETSIHMCREIYRFFVYHQVDKALEDDIVQEMAGIFTANEYKLQPVLEALFTSQHFYDGAAGVDDNNFGSIIKSPLELILGFMRTFNISMPDYQTELEAYNNFTERILEDMSDQGMDYYEPFEVAGYSAYHQFPIYNRSWITTNYLTNRYEFIRLSLSDGTNMEMGQVDVFDFVEQNFQQAVIRVVDDFIIAMAEYVLPSAEALSFSGTAGELTVERLNYFKSLMLAFDVDGDPEQEWTNRWNENRDRNTRANQIMALLNAMLQSPEYQLM